MADVRESFPSLEDGSGVGTPLRSAQEGDSVAAKNGSLAFAFKDGSGNAIAAPVKVAGTATGNAVPTLPGKNTAGNSVELPVKAAGDAPTTAQPVLAFLDSSGNLVHPQLNASGQLPVTFNSTGGDGKKGRGKIAGNASLTTVASITLANSKTYDKLDFIVSCTRDALFQVILSDNAVETIISEAIVGSGQMSFHGALKEAEIASGATGTQLLLIKAQNINALSDLHASLSVTES